MRFTAILLASTLIACTEAMPSNAQNAGTPAPAAQGTQNANLPFTVTEVADLTSPWAMAFLPDGRMLITEKAGEMLLMSADGRQKRTIATIPVDSAGQGGLMDVVLAPGFAQNRQVYFSYSVAGDGGKGVVLARGVLGGDAGSEQLTGITELFRATPFVDGNGHYSGRITFAPDGQHLFFTNGERQKFTPAQDPQATLGKVLRLTLDGQPAGDPGLRSRGFHPAVWSYGHRNLLGISFDSAGNLWEQEMGPEGGDELNLILPGRNYGYPLASNGRNYGASTNDIPDHLPGDGFEAPKVWWTPVISPAGLLVYTGAMFPEWQGDIFIGGLSSQALVRVNVDGTNASKGDQWPMGTRIRDVEQGPDGAIWLLEDGLRGANGKVMKLTRR